MELTSGTPVDRYVLEAPLGAGGMAVVWRARHAQIGSLHAIKVLTVPSLAIRDRLLQEGRVQGGLRHPNLVAVTDVVTLGGAPALVLEYVRGPSLAQLLCDQVLTLDQADELARGILKGVAAAHRKGVLHRDLKPGNVLISIEDGALVPKVADFGLAKVLAGELSTGDTRSGVAMGTPAYMPPEQIRDAKTVDARADVFALGAILYELVTGRRAFDGRDVVEIFNRVCEGRYEPVGDEVPERMRAAIEAALQTDPARRPEDGAALLALWTEGASSLPPRTWDPEVVARAVEIGSGADVPSFAPSPVAGSDPTWTAEAPPSSDLTWALEPAGAPTMAPREAPPSARDYALFFLAGTLITAPFVVGDTIFLFGSVAEAARIGGWPMYALLGAVAVAGGATAALGVWQRHGGARALAWWCLAPALVVGIGAAGMGLGSRAVAGALGRLPPDADAASILASGVAEAMTAELAGLAFAATICLFIAAVAAFNYRTVFVKTPTSERQLAAIPAVAAVGGMGIWAWDSWFYAGGPAPFLVFVVVVAAALCASLVATDLPEHDPGPAAAAKALVGLGAVAAIDFSAKAVHIKNELSMLRGVAEQAPGDRLLAAEVCSTRLEAGGLSVVAGWIALGVVVALGSWVKTRRPPLRELFPLRQIAPIVVVFALSAGAYTLAKAERYALQARVVPAYVEQAVRWAFGARLEDGPRGPVVTDPGPTGLAVGDVIVAFGGREVLDVRDLLGHVGACRCEGGGGCALPGPCLAPGAVVELTVVRAGQLGAAAVPVRLGE